MGDTTKIAWTDHTFNGWIGCEKISPACKNCYAAVDTYARVSASRGLPLWGPGSSRHVTSDANWKKPLTWNRAAAKAGKRSRVFAHSLSDVFEDRPELVAPRARLFRLIQDTPNLDWQLLTKRPENIRRLSAGGPFAERFPLNVWLGTTVENQEFADARIPHLLAVEAGQHFVSCEPLLEPIDLVRFMSWRIKTNGWNGPEHWVTLPAAGESRGIDQVIVGGESGNGARPMHKEWAVSLRDQCKARGVTFHFKQWGEHDEKLIKIGKKKAGRLLDGRTWDEFPEARA